MLAGTRKKAAAAAGAAERPRSKNKKRKLNRQARATRSSTGGSTNFEVGIIQLEQLFETCRLGNGFSRRGSGEGGGRASDDRCICTAFLDMIANIALGGVRGQQPLFLLEGIPCLFDHTFSRGFRFPRVNCRTNAHHRVCFLFVHPHRGQMPRLSGSQQSFWRNLFPFHFFNFLEAGASVAQDVTRSTPTGVPVRHLFGSR